MSKQASVKEKDLKMGLSSNQARFLSLTSRQVDMEHRIQQICQRRLRLSSELENVATAYNNSISNRKMFTPSNAGLNKLDLNTLKSLGYKVIDATTKTLANAPMKAITQLSETAALSSGYDAAHIIHNASEFVSKITSDLGGNFILTSDIDMSELGTLSTSAINGVFTGNFDGNGYIINNLNINSAGSFCGLFADTTGANLSNIAIENANISTAASLVGILAGRSSNSTIDNCYSTGSVNGNAAFTYAGGLVGQSVNSDISYSYSTADVTGVNRVGGLVGESWQTSTVSNCYATGDVQGGDWTGGLVGNNTDNSIIENSYAVGDVYGGGGMLGVGGVVGHQDNNSITRYCYAAGDVYSSTAAGGVSGANVTGSSDDSSNFYRNNMATDAGGAITNQATATSGWNTTVWDLSTNLPSLISTGGINSSRLEEGLRNGKYSLAREADEFTQTPLLLQGEEYEEIDWRSTPDIFDELYKGDDVDAENKYDKTVEEINAQDKKLQLEQTSIEVEYKAINSERESVKKILDQNAQSSFKYFS